MILRRNKWWPKALLALTIVWATTAVFGPAASLEHTLEHASERTAEAPCPSDDHSSEQGETGRECDLCSFLANGRLAIAVEDLPEATRALVADRTVPAQAPLLPSQPGYAVASPRGPPIS